MSREEAILILKELWKYEHIKYEDCEVRTAIDLAIEALEQEQYYKGLAKSYEKTINKLIEAITEQGQNDGK